MEVIVLGTGCSSCKNLYQTVEKAVEELGSEIALRKEEDIMKIMEYNVMRMPALVVDGKIISSGKKLSVAEVKALLTPLLK
ncbi:MAG: thioredoxin family protein [Bacteroidales bacterium]